MIAHIAGVPAEEFLPVIVSGVGTGLFVKLTAVVPRARRLRGHRHDRGRGPGGPVD